MLLSERFNRSVIRIGEVTLTHHIMSAWDPCFVFRLNRFTTDTHCFCKSPTLGNSEITKLLHNGTAHLPGIIISRQPHHFTLGELRRMHTGSREPPRPLSDNPNAHSLFWHWTLCYVTTKWSLKTLYPKSSLRTRPLSCATHATATNQENIGSPCTWTRSVTTSTHTDKSRVHELYERTFLAVVAERSYSPEPYIYRLWSILRRFLKVSLL